MQNLHVQDFTPEPPRETFLLHGKSKKNNKIFSPFFLEKARYVTVGSHKTISMDTLSFIIIKH